MLTFPEKIEQVASYKTAPNPRGTSENQSATLDQRAHACLLPHARHCRILTMPRTGLSALCTNTDCSLLVIPGPRDGMLALNEIAPGAKRGPQILHAHRHSLASLALSYSGELVASASSRGTLIRVRNTFSGVLLHEVRRGYTPSAIHSLRFSRNAALLCAASERTLHIFQLGASAVTLTAGAGGQTGAGGAGIGAGATSAAEAATAGIPAAAKAAAMAAAGGGWLGWTTTSLLGQRHPRSDITLHVPAPAVCAFGANNATVLAVCGDGTLHVFPLTRAGVSAHGAHGAHGVRQGQGGVAGGFVKLFRPDDARIFRLTPAARTQREGVAAQA